MAATPTVYRGSDAQVWIVAKGVQLTHSTLALSDFGITFDKGVVEQELVGEAGNYFIGGSLSADGSLTSCKIHNTAIGYLVDELISGNPVEISGNCGSNSLHFFFRSAQITGFDLSLGDADTITEGSIDFTLLKPYLVSSVGFLVSDGACILTDQPLENVGAKLANW